MAQKGKKGTIPWLPKARQWEGAQLSEDGRRLVYITGEGAPVDPAYVRREPERLTVTLSRMQLATGFENMAACYHCVEVALSAPAHGLILIDGANGLRANAKESTYLDPQRLKGTERTLEGVFTPREFLTAREFTE